MNTAGQARRGAVIPSHRPAKATRLHAVSAPAAVNGPQDRADARGPTKGKTGSPMTIGPKAVREVLPASRENGRPKSECGSPPENAAHAMKTAAQPIAERQSNHARSAKVSLPAAPHKDRGSPARKKTAPAITAHAHAAAQIARLRYRFMPTPARSLGRNGNNRPECRAIKRTIAHQRRDLQKILACNLPLSCTIHIHLYLKSTVNSSAARTLLIPIGARRLHFHRDRGGSTTAWSGRRAAAFWCPYGTTRSRRSTQRPTAGKAVAAAAGRYNDETSDSALARACIITPPCADGRRKNLSDRG